MNAKKEKLLNETYQKWMQAGLYDLPLDNINEFIDPKIMGYGTAIDEKVLSISEYKQLINRQREQAVGIEIVPKITPIFRSVTNKEDAAIFVDEINVQMIIDSEKHELFLRITTLLEYIDSNWIVVHWHGSIPTETKAEDDAWLVNEWKRKNAELEKLVSEKTSELINKNRELEIETALEKVRSSALSLKQPGDMVDVCLIISDQLELLGVNDIRNVQTAIINEQRGTYLNYQYFTAYNKSVIEETEYHKHPTVFAMVEEMKKSANSTFNGIMKGKELITFREWRKLNNQFPDPILDKVDSVHYYFYSIGLGGLGLTTYKPLPEEGLDVFKRFHNVFTLAYRRFVDIEIAIAQAREAQIEVALERVRSRSMAMHSSDEFVDASDVMVNQLKELGIDTLRIGIGIINKKDNSVEIWSRSEIKGKAKNTILGIVPAGTHPIFDDMVMSWKEKKLFFSSQRVGDEVKEYYEKLDPCLSYPKRKEFNERETMTAFFFSHGSLNVVSLEPLKEEDCNIMIRFAKVFGQIYQRFLDLQKAEAQAREAKIEAALERVRSRSMAMHKSDELLEAGELLYRELSKLGIANLTCGYVLMDEDEKVGWNYGVNPGDGTIKPQPTGVPKTGTKILQSITESWKKQKPSLLFELDEEETIEHQTYIAENSPNFQISAEKLLSISPKRLVIHTFNFKHGYLLIVGAVVLNANQQEMVTRFAKVFEQTYTRFLDLKKAEAQARESEIQLALEKVRMVALSLNKSEEMLKVAKALYEELVKLGFSNIRNAIIDINNGDDDTFTDYDYSQEMSGTITQMSYHDDPTLEGQFKKMSTTTNDFFELVLESKELEDLIAMREKNGEAEDPRLLNTDILTYNLYSFGNGAIGISNFGILSEEEKSILNRFSNVFTFAYKRYNDLTTAEAQAREAQIEAALERVRSRSMGMQKSEELKEVIRVVYEQFIHLKINVDHAGFVVDYTPRGDWHFWIADEQDIPSKITHPYFESVWANQFNEAKEKGADFFATNLNFEEKNKFYNELLSYVPGLPEASKDFYLSCPGLAGSTVLLDNVGLYIENFSGIPYSDEENKILMRFGKVFQQTYTRFLDLQKAEAQAREAQIEAALERVRSRTMAMQKSEELTGGCHDCCFNSCRH